MIIEWRKSSQRKATIKLVIQCDLSFFEGVNKILMIVLYAAVPSVILILIIILVVYCYRRHKRKQLHIVKSTESIASPQTHWVSPHIRSLENSPVTNRSPLIHTTSFVTSKHSANPESSPKRDSKRVTIVDHLDMEEFKRSPERNNVNGGVQLHEANRDRKHIVTPCGENNIKEVATRVHVDGALRTPPQHYRTHQKRPSYHLMQEFNMEGTDILQWRFNSFFFCYSLCHLFQFNELQIVCKDIVIYIFI